MAKIKFTKGELKKQRDALKAFLRFLPTLQLKKQQLQMEILNQLGLLEERKQRQRAKHHAVEAWAGLLKDPRIDIRQWIKPSNIVLGQRNIAGVDLPVFTQAQFADAEYDLFVTPSWVDAAIDELRILVSLNEEIKILEKGIQILRYELRITNQRVNLFEKVKIPETEEAIRLIKIYIGDQLTNAVGRSKIAKKKIEEYNLAEVSV